MHCAGLTFEFVDILELGHLPSWFGPKQYRSNATARHLHYVDRDKWLSSVGWGCGSICICICVAHIFVLVFALRGSWQVLEQGAWSSVWWGRDSAGRRDTDTETPLSPCLCPGYISASLSLCLPPSFGCTPPPIYLVHSRELKILWERDVCAHGRMNFCPFSHFLPPLFIKAPLHSFVVLIQLR